MTGTVMRQMCFQKEAENDKKLHSIHHLGLLQMTKPESLMK